MVSKQWPWANYYNNTTSSSIFQFPIHNDMTEIVSAFLPWQNFHLALILNDISNIHLKYTIC